MIFAAGNFAGPLVLGRLFDTVGRKIMVSLCYLGSAVAGIALGLFLIGGSTSEWTFIALVGVTFFLASAGASAAYLTVSEIFPMETRALAIAFFYSVGTAVGGITGPLLFGHLIDSGNRHTLAIGFVIGAVVMALGGLAEIVFGVNAEGKALESIAEPLTAASGASSSPAPRRSATGLRRYRPGVGASRAYAPRMSYSTTDSVDPGELQREVEAIVRVLEIDGPLDRTALAQALRARYWGPGRFRVAFREAMEQGRIRPVAGRTFEASSTAATSGRQAPAQPA